MKWLAIFAASLLALGCARNAPYVSGPDLEGRVRATVAGADGASEVFPDAAWYPYVDGFAYVRTGEGGGRRGFFKGAVVLTGEALLFVIYDEDLQRLEAVKRIAYADVRSVEVDHLGLGTLLVVRQPRRVVHSFGFASSGFADPIAAEPARRAAAAMKLRLAQAGKPS
ncbi:MAG TPA: hypothetical protein VNU21_21465 [Usitatibacter sp.]|nr:hypothetical protein [Usitatibacter sp.]